MIKNIVILLLISSCLYSQQDNLPLLNLQNQKYNSSLEKLYQSRSVIRNTVAQVLESEIDENEYIVGPGDLFKVSIFGELENDYEEIVHPEGDILIPTLGKFHIGGLSLKAAKKVIYDAIQENYLKSKIIINLIGLRKFRVYYTGEVKSPGTYFAQGSDRVSDIVEVSVMELKQVVARKEDGELHVINSINDWGDDTRIEIHHKDGTLETVDLTRFYNFGDKSQNPYLQGGDLIYVPPIDLSDSLITVEGNVDVAGVYRLKGNENLIGFLTRVSALSKRSDLKKIVLERNGDTKEIDLINDLEKYKSLRLEHGDKISVRAIYENVYVRGEVFLPGPFPYRANYTARDYIGQAGATDNSDDVSEALIHRQSTGEVLHGGDVIVEKGDTIIMPKRPREIVKDYISILAPVIYLGVNIYYIVTR